MVIYDDREGKDTEAIISPDGERSKDERRMKGGYVHGVRALFSTVPLLPRNYEIAGADRAWITRLSRTPAPAVRIDLPWEREPYVGYKQNRIDAGPRPPLVARLIAAR